MALNLIQDRSPADLKQKIDSLVGADLRPLPIKAKVFAAVAKIQGFDSLPTTADPDEINALVAQGHKELHRGIASSEGVSADIYAEQLMKGLLHPGTQTAYGQGIYFSTPSRETSRPHFPRMSDVAHRYATSTSGVGVIVRCTLDREVSLPEQIDLCGYFRDEKNRAKRAGIVDLGTFAAACGFPGYICDGIEPNRDEEVVVILDRSKLLFRRVWL